MNMKTITLNNDIEMLVLGLGVYQLNGKECERCVSEAVEIGYRLFDTAQMYGNEKSLGNALKYCGIPRNELFITTKLYSPSRGYELARSAIEESLDSLQTDKGVHFVGRNNGIADENAPINWSYQFSGKVNYLPTCVTETTYVINLANLKGHSYGITLCGKNHFGSFINNNALRPPEGANLHGWLTKSEMGIYSPLVDLMANSELGGKTVLYMLDAIICAPSEGASITEKNSKWQQAPFNNDYTSSIFVSQDPVAIDSVGADFLNNEPTITENNSAAKDVTNENYLHEAGLVSNAPSGITYTDGNGHIVTNLGVHEHWNNSDEKLYSRNLGKNEGIEFIQRMTAASQTTLGDVNSDGKFNVADVILLQKWLLAVPNTQLVDWKAADLCEDDRLNVFDLCLMKRELLKQK